MDAWDIVYFAAWMAPWLGFALVALYVGYVAYQTRQAKERAAHAPVASGPDPVAELEAINTELGRAAAQARLHTDAIRAAFQRGIR